MPIRKSGLSSVFQILFALCIATFCISGCLEKATGPMQELSSVLSDQVSDSRLEMDYEVELSRDLFRLQGDLLFPGAADLGYILLNASLSKEKSPVLSTKYLLMQIEPDHEYGFEICKSCRIESGDYDCILRAEAPQGLIAEEVRKVSLVESRDRPEVWSQAEEAAFWQMIEEYERAEDVEREMEEEDGGDEYASKEDERDEDVGKEDERDEDGIEDNGGGGYELNANDVGKESLQEPSHSESSSIALFLGYPARGDEDEISSHEAILVASKSSKKYHRPDCRFAQKIKPENLISFSSFEDARREGYLPCKVCNP
jgi:hypothetical protein